MPVVIVLNHSVDNVLICRARGKHRLFDLPDTDELNVIAEVVCAVIISQVYSWHCV